MVVHFVHEVNYDVNDLNILNNLSLCAAKGGRSPERERRAGQKHGPPAAGEGAAWSREGEPAEGVWAGERNMRPAEKREPSKLRVDWAHFWRRIWAAAFREGRKMFVAVVKMFSVKQEALFLFCFMLFLVVNWAEHTDKSAKLYDWCSSCCSYSWTVLHLAKQSLSTP